MIKAFQLLWFWVAVLYHYVIVVFAWFLLLHFTSFSGLLPFTSFSGSIGFAVLFYLVG